MDEYDVIVVGRGPAGESTAGRCAAAGLSIAGKDVRDRASETVGGVTFTDPQAARRADPGATVIGPGVQGGWRPGRDLPGEVPLA